MFSEKESKYRNSSTPGAFRNKVGCAIGQNGAFSAFPIKMVLSEVLVFISVHFHVYFCSICTILECVLCVNFGCFSDDVILVFCFSEWVTSSSRVSPLRAKNEKSASITKHQIWGVSQYSGLHS